METQTIEWKSSWRDEYLEELCGFANAQGGVLEIGRDDKGIVVGLTDPVKLLEVLPNKIRTTMGIVADVNLCHENEKEYIAVKVTAHHNAISYRGKYYYRSGSTNQELTGYSLDELLLGKYGKTWDAVPVPYIKADDFYKDAFDVFRKKAVTSKRLLQEDVEVTDAELLQTLKLTEGNYILRAASLLFHQDPERWCLGSYVKIGYFENDAEILYQDEINGPLITLPDRVMDAIFTKYFKGLIRYEGIQRIDEYPMPREVLREAVLNSVVHKDYSTGNPIHIKIYDDKVIIYNDFQLPINIRPETLLQGRIGSKPHNPLVASVFFRSGQIEAWGRGIEKMRKGCVADGLSEPEFEIASTVFSICFRIRNNNKAIAERSKIYSTNESGTKRGLNGGLNELQQSMIALFAKKPTITTQAVADTLGITRRSVEHHVSQLKQMGVLEREGAKKNGRWALKGTVGAIINRPCNANQYV